MANRTWEMTIEGLDEVEHLLENLGPKLETNLWIAFNKYVEKNLVTRMKERLSKATQPMENSNIDPNTGIASSGGGGYGVPQNSEKYAEWKKSRSNLPVAGALSTRELVATGYLVDSISVTTSNRSAGDMSWEVGAKPGERPSVVPFKNVDKDSNQADLSKRIENTQLMEWIEDSKYAFLAKEYEDVMRDIEPLVLFVLKTTLLQLLKETVKSTSKGIK